MCFFKNLVSKEVNSAWEENYVLFLHWGSLNLSCCTFFFFFWQMFVEFTQYSKRLNELET